jgi:periplasmic divalent cation tolerance protein
MIGESTAQNIAGQDSDGVALIYTTFPLQSQAQQMGRILVEAGLAACVNIFPSMKSVYSWEGEIQEADETAMIIKTARSRTDEVMALIVHHHPDDVPARLVLPVAGGGHDFLDWIMKQTTAQ